MGPCIMQMSMVLAAFVSGIPPSQIPKARRLAVGPVSWFLLGYLAIFGLAAAALMALGDQFPALQQWMRGGSGLVVAASGALLLSGRPAANSCEGPNGFLLRYGRWHPVGMGAAYALYCAGCCGPYLAGVGLILAGRGLSGGAAVGSLLLALVMAAPVVVPLVARTDRVQQWLSRHDRTLRLASGLFLAGTGAVIALGAIGQALARG